MNTKRSNKKGKASKKTLLDKLLGRLKGKKSRDFARNTAILNETPKNHKPSRSKVVQK